MKKILIFSLILILLFVAVISIAVFADENRSGVQKNMITQKETAIAIGTALIKEHFPEDFEKIKTNITAEEKEGIWKVYNVNPKTKVINGKVGYLVGGGIFVEFRKDNGEIINMGIND